VRRSALGCDGVQGPDIAGGAEQPSYLYLPPSRTGSTSSMNLAYIENLGPEHGCLCCAGCRHASTPAPFPPPADRCHPPCPNGRCTFTSRNRRSGARRFQGKPAIHIKPDWRFCGTRRPRCPHLPASLSREPTPRYRDLRHQPFPNLLGVGSRNARCFPTPNCTPC
jgi:hypothetical protein